jgi:hypothetical protein
MDRDSHLPAYVLNPSASEYGSGGGLSKGVTAAEAEKELILRTLQLTGNNKAEAARQLGLDVKTIRNKLKAYGISWWGYSGHECKPARAISEDSDAMPRHAVPHRAGGLVIQTSPSTHAGNQQHRRRSLQNARNCCKPSESDRLDDSSTAGVNEEIGYVKRFRKPREFSAKLRHWTRASSSEQAEVKRLSTGIRR